MANCLISVVPNLPTVKASMLPPSIITWPHWIRHSQLQTVFNLYYHSRTSQQWILSVLWHHLAVHQDPGIRHKPSKEVLPHSHQDHHAAWALPKCHLSSLPQILLQTDPRHSDGFPGASHCSKPSHGEDVEQRALATYPNPSKFWKCS